MKIINASIIIFYNDKKEILLQDRKHNSKAGEEWGFFGGSVEVGETTEQALVREIKEELDIDLVDPKFLFTYHNIYISPINNEEVDLTTHVFIAPLGNKLAEFKIIDGNFKMYSLKEARKLKLLPGQIEILDEVQYYLDDN